MSGVGFVGFRTHRYDEMVDLFRDRIGLRVVREAPGAMWFRLGDDAELHVYADTDPDHAFFTTGPVVGLRVDDFRAPDGTVLEIIGPNLLATTAGQAASA